MPKDTFHNLSEDKKRKIFDAAVKEFSSQRFSEASINQIVKSAGIPRGSFYQYFEGKEDIFLYIMEEISKDKWDIMKSKDSWNPEADVFEIILESTRESFELCREKPEYLQIGMQMELDDSRFIAKLRMETAGKYIKLVERDKERGLIKPDVDSELVIHMIFSYGLADYFRNGFDEYFREGWDEEKYIEKCKRVIKIIKEGVSTVEE